MANVTRPAPQPFHPPVGISDETYPPSGRWLAIATAIVILFAAGLAVLLRP